MIEIRPGEDGMLYMAEWEAKPFHWLKLDGGRWMPDDQN